MPRNHQDPDATAVGINSHDGSEVECSLWLLLLLRAVSVQHISPIKAYVGAVLSKGSQ